MASQITRASQSPSQQQTPAAQNNPSAVRDAKQGYESSEMSDDGEKADFRRWQRTQATRHLPRYAEAMERQATLSPLAKPWSPAETMERQSRPAMVNRPPGFGSPHAHLRVNPGDPLATDADRQRWADATNPNRPQQQPQPLGEPLRRQQQPQAACAANGSQPQVFASIASLPRPSPQPDRGSCGPPKRTKSTRGGQNEGADNGYGRRSPSARLGSDATRRGYDDRVHRPSLPDDVRGKFIGRPGAIRRFTKNTGPTTKQAAPVVRARNGSDNEG